MKNRVYIVVKHSPVTSRAGETLYASENIGVFAKKAAAETYLNEESKKIRESNSSGRRGSFLMVETWENIG